MLSIGELPEDIIITDNIMMMLAAILWSQPYYDHNHIMMMLAAIYDSEVYIKSDEYFQKTRKLCNEQAKLEKAQVYLV